jgi:hypothetical protein
MGNNLRAVKAEARQNSESFTTSLKWWWVEKFKLPPNHELFIVMDYRELMVLYYEEQWMEYKRLLNYDGELSQDGLKDLRRMKQVLGLAGDGSADYHDTGETTPWNKAYLTGDPMTDAIESAIASGDDKLAGELLEKLGS